MGTINKNRLSTKRIINVLTKSKIEARQRYRAEIKGIFGSFVRGDDKRKSDIDILVEFDERANLIDFVGLSLFLEEKMKRSIDVVPESAIRKELKAKILKEVIYI
jgi:predicted nucleotidyltransferase